MPIPSPRFSPRPDPPGPSNADADLRLGRRLVEARLLASGTLASLLAECAARRPRLALAELLLERRLVAPQDVVRALARVASETLADRETVVGPPPRSDAGSGRFGSGRGHSPRPGSGRLAPATGTRRFQADASASGAAGDGPRLLDRYVLAEELGRGGMGVVCRAYDEALQRPVAIKMLGDGSRPADDRQWQRFRREAVATAKLRHPAIVAIHEVGDEGGVPFIVMDLVEGASLEAVLAGEELSPRRVAEIAREVALALQHAHDHGVVHRDVKPENILVDRDGQPRLTDFGLARELGADQITVSGQVVGTPAYIAPEQAGRSGGVIGPAADVYAVGGVLYRALVGRPPFVGDALVNVIQMVLFEEPEPPRRSRPAVHPDLETIALRCLEKEPDRRYPSARALAADLERFLAGEVIDARPVGRLERARRWARRNRLLAASLALVVLVVVGAAAAGTWLVVATRRQIAAERRAGQDEARERAAAAWAAFEDARDQAAVGDRLDRRRADRLLARGLDAVAAAAALRTLAPEDEDAARRAFDAAMATGEVALRAEQWGVAASAFESARGLGVADGEARAAIDRVEESRRQATDALRREVEGILAEARSGELGARPGGYDDALFGLVRRADPETVRILAATLGELRAVLREAVGDMIRAAQHPNEDEARAGETSIEGLEEALVRWLAKGPDETIDESDESTVGLAAGRIVRRARRSHPDLATQPTMATYRRQMASAQAAALGPAGELTARLCCEALGRIGVREEALPALIAYLQAEEDELRAVPAGVAICLLGGEEAEHHVLRAARLFGRAGPYWRRVRRYLERTGAAEVDVADLEGAASAVELVELGRTHTDRGERDEALAAYERAIELDPDHGPAWVGRSGVKLARGDLDGALADIERALEISPRSGWFLAERGAVFVHRGDLQRARRDFDRAIVLAPGLAEPRRRRAKLRRRTGDLVGAQTDVERAIELSPGDASLWTLRGDLRTDVDLAGALADFDHALQLDPEHAQANLGRGVVRHRMGDLEGAIADVAVALERSPGNALVWTLRSGIRLEQGDLRAAIADADRAIELDPEAATAWVQRGRARAAAGELTAALEDFDRAVELDAGSSFALVERAIVLRASGRPDDAIRDLDRAVVISPAKPKAWNVLGASRVSIGDVTGAREAFDRAVSLAPGSHVFLTNRGRVRTLQGDHAGAIEDLEKAVRLAPQHAPGWNNLGAAREAAGDRQGALREYGRAIDLDPEDVEPRNNRGVLLHRLGRFEESILDFDRVLALAPRHLSGWRNRGLVRWRLMQLRGAIADLERFCELAPPGDAIEEARGYIERMRRGEAIGGGG